MAHFRKANEFRHDSERRTADLLRKSLPDDCHLVANYVLPSREGGGEIDLVAIMPQGIVALEVKHWYGQLAHVGRLIEFEDGWRTDNPFPGMSYKAKTLRSALMNAQLIDGRLPVGSALVHTLPLAWPDNVRASEFVFELKVLTSAKPLLQTLARGSAKDATLSPKQVAAVAHFLAEETSGIDTWSVSHYVLDEKVDSSGHAEHYLGRCAHVFERNVVLRCWEIDATAEPAVRARTLRELEREAAALARLERHRCPAIPVVYDAFRDPSNFNVFWLVHEFVGRATLQTRAHEFVRDAAFRSRVLEQLDEALAVLRAESMVHRNLRADVIHLAEDDDDRVLLGGFEFSASETDTTLRRTVLRPEERPPEVKRGDRPSAAGDVYAVARMMLDIVKPGDAPPKQRLREVKTVSLRKALEIMLDDDPKRRPADLRALRDAARGSIA